MAKVYRSDSRVEDYPPPANGTDYNLEELRAAIGGGYIEILPLMDGLTMVIDEQGKLKDMPPNNQATLLYRQGRNTTDFIVGDALVCQQGEID